MADTHFQVTSILPSWRADIISGFRLPFSFYDFFAYVIPGIVAIVPLCTLLLPLGFNAQVPAEIGGPERLVLGLLLAYVAGIIVQAISKRLESFIWKLDDPKEGRYPSQRYLEEDGHYSTELRTQIIKAASDFFGLDAEQPKAQEIFNLCYSFVTQKDLNPRIHTFIASYTLYRGLIVASGWAATLYLATAVLQWSQQADPRLVTSSVVLSLGAAGACWLFSHRFKGQGKAFADEVYRNFYVYYQTPRREKQR